MKKCDDCGKRVFRWVEFEDDNTILCRKCYKNILSKKDVLPNKEEIVINENITETSDAKIDIEEKSIKQEFSTNKFYSEIEEKKVTIDIKSDSLITCWSCGKKYFPSSNCPHCGAFRKREWQGRKYFD